MNWLLPHPFSMFCVKNVTLQIGGEKTEKSKTNSKMVSQLIKSLVYWEKKYSAKNMQKVVQE